MAKVRNCRVITRVDCKVDSLLAMGLNKSSLEQRIDQDIVSKVVVNKPGDEIRIVHTKDHKICYLEGWEFEGLGIRPFGWKTNPYDADQYDLQDSLLYDTISRMWWDNIGKGQILYDTEQQIPYCYNEEDGVWQPDPQKRGLLDTCNAFFGIARHAMECIDDPAYKDLFFNAVIKPFRANGGLNIVSTIMEGLKTIPESHVTSESFDSDPYRFNMANGVYNFNSRSFEPGHRPEDMMTRISPVNYDPKATAPRFERFLSEIFMDDPDKAQFLMRWFGYSLTGLIREAKIVICRGKGRNGKSVLENVVSAVAGDYAGVANEASLCMGSSGGNNENLAGMDGKHVVFSNELSADKQLDASMIKQLTGGDTVMASYKYGHLHRINIKAKLTLWTNNIPRMRDDALLTSGRLVIVSFNSVIPAAKQDKNLTNKLMEELPGIFNLLADGFTAYNNHCNNYGNTGDLQIPGQIVSESAMICNDNNQFAVFVQSHLSYTGNPGDIIKSKELYQRYAYYAHEEAGFTPPGITSFNSKLTDRGLFPVVRTHAGGRYALYGWIWRDSEAVPQMDEQELTEAFERTRQYGLQLVAAKNKKSS